MPNFPEDRIIQHLAEERGMKIEKINRDSRLMQDLGMHGDDAVEFFEAFGGEFDVDLDELYKDWDSYFAQESGGGGFLGILAGLLSIIVIGGGAGYAGAVIGAPEWLVYPAAIVVWFGLGFFWPFGRQYEPITIDDLVRAAQAGKWKKTLPQPNRNRS